MVTFVRKLFRRGNCVNYSLISYRSELRMLHRDEICISSYFLGKRAPKTEEDL